MKILHIPNYMHPHIGGIEQTARDIINSVPEGTEQRVICFGHERGDKTDKVDGVDVVRADCFAKVFSQSLSFSYERLLKKQFAQFRPDTVVFHYPNPFVAHLLLKQLKKYPDCKLVLWWHLDITKQKLLGKFFNNQTEKLLKRACRIITTSPNYMQSSPFLSRYNQKCTVIHSCINEERLREDKNSISIAKRIREENKDKIICFAIGRHVEYKGYEYLIEASSMLGDGYAVYLGGDGELTEKLKRLAAGDKKIKFLGRISDEELKAYMSACDIYCFPSITKNEAFGLALAEAMSFGKPAVTFTIEGSGVNFVNLRDVTGLEVENRNSQAFAQAIMKLGEDKKLRSRLGKNAANRVEELFTFSKFRQNVLNLFEGLKEDAEK